MAASDGLFLGIDHPAIACRDSARQIEWYCRHLGMRLIATDGKTPPAAVVGYGSGDAEGEAMIELMPARDVGADPADQPRFQVGLRHLALRVSDFDAARQRLQAAGAEFITDPGPALGGGKIASFRDPEGNELQIVER